MKKCSQCGETKPDSMFGVEPRAKDGRRYSCLECDRVRHKRYHEANKDRRNAAARERRRANPEQDRLYQQNYRRRFVWRTVLQHARKRAAKFGWAFDLDDHLEEMKARIGAMRCELTGVELRPGVGAGSQGKRFWNTPSLDRIDPTKGYTIDNVRVVCWAMNAALGTWGEQVLRQIVSAWIAKEKEG